MILKQNKTLAHDQIRLKGRLDPSWSFWFEKMALALRAI
jgi:hypothetical protein